jgi:hypothetical protein
VNRLAENCHARLQHVIKKLLSPQGTLRAREAQEARRTSQAAQVRLSHRASFYRDESLTNQANNKITCGTEAVLNVSGHKTASGRILT